MFRQGGNQRLPCTRGNRFLPLARKAVIDESQINRYHHSVLLDVSVSHLVKLFQDAACQEPVRLLLPPDCFALPRKPPAWSSCNLNHPCLRSSRLPLKQTGGSTTPSNGDSKDDPSLWMLVTGHLFLHPWGLNRLIEHQTPPLKTSASVSLGELFRHQRPWQRFGSLLVLSRCFQGSHNPSTWIFHPRRRHVFD